jgi:hypothetical protein
MSLNKTQRTNVHANAIIKHDFFPAFLLLYRADFLQHFIPFHKEEVSVCAQKILTL